MAKRNEEFNKWWQYCMSTLAQNRVIVSHPTPGNKPCADVERTVDTNSGNLYTPQPRESYSLASRLDQGATTERVSIKLGSGDSQLM
jgi:hypothetical protein